MKIPPLERVSFIEVLIFLVIVGIVAANAFSVYHRLYTPHQTYDAFPSKY